MVGDLKSKSVKGVIWSFVESASTKVIQFVISVIMARLLMPEDYGIVAIIFVFITISQVFIDGGFATTLIQDKYKTERDYSTIFTFNVLLSVCCYLILFFAAPYISSFYNNDVTLYLRVQSLGIIIFSFSAIHKVRMTVDVNFKAIAKVTVISALFSGVVGIILAFKGGGVWALVGQYLTSAVVMTGMYTITQRWKPVCFFDVSSFHRLFPFGTRLMAASIIDKIYANLYPIIIGKFCTPAQLGYYSRAEQFTSMPAYICVEVFSRVTFPIMSKITDERQLISVYRKYISLSSYIIIPLLFVLLVLAKPLVLILLTEKWADVIVLMQILCCGFLLEHISCINRNLIYVKGRADLALKLEVIKKVTAFLILIISVPFGLIGLCVGKASYGLLAMVLNSAYTKKLIGISIWEQIKDFTPSMVLGIIGVPVALIPVYSFDNMYMQFFVGGFVFFVCYVGLSIITKNESLKEIIAIIKKNL